MLQNSPQPHEEVVALLEPASEARMDGRYDEALGLFQQALEKSRTLNDKAGEEIALNNLGFVYHRAGDPQKALDFYAQLLSLNKAAGDQKGEAATRINLGLVYQERGDLERALESFQEARTLAKALEYPEVEARALIGIGEICQSAGDLEKALASYQEALPLVKARGIPGGEARTLNNIGLMYHQLGDPERALECYQEALPRTQEVGDQEGEAMTRICIGLASEKLGRLQMALESYQEALTLIRTAGVQSGALAVLERIGAVCTMAGDLEMALETYQEAVRLAAQDGEDKAVQARMLNNLGYVYQRTGALQKARDSYEQSLKVAGDSKAAVAPRINLGSVYKDLGSLQLAFQAYQEALRLAKSVEDTEGTAHTLIHIGEVYEIAGDPQKALEPFQQALEIFQQAPKGKAGEAMTWNNIGLAYQKLDDLPRALESYQKALPLKQAIGDIAGQAITLNNIATMLLRLGHPQEALQPLQEALSLAEIAGDRECEALTLNNIGQAYRNLNQGEKALKFYQDALTRISAAGIKLRQARTLANVAAAEASRDHPVPAGDAFGGVVALLEATRTSLGELYQAKVSFLESYLPVYHTYIDLLLQQGDPVAAFDLAQKTQARALLDLVRSGRVDLSKDLSAAEKQEERELELRLSELNRQLLAEAIKENPEKEQLDKLLQQSAEAERALQMFQDTLIARHPDAALSRAAQTVTLSDVAEFLPEDTALLDYVVLRANDLDRTVLFCVTWDQGKPVLKTYDLEGDHELFDEKAGDYRQACAEKRDNYATKARELYDRLLGPAGQQLDGKKRLILCPDGPLWGLPFHALMVTDPTTRTRRFVAEQYEVTYAYSATAVQTALRKKADPQRPAPTGTLLVFSNPDLGDETRFLEPQTLEDPDRAPLAIVGRDRRDLALTVRGGMKSLKEAQKHTEEEANAIQSYFPDASPYPDKKAQEAAAKQEAGKYRYLHFATHGILNNRAPLQSGVLLAEPPPDSDEDGFLTAREIFDLNLSADMVVLSACETGLGQRRGGEGIVGLTWALSAAGAPTQVVSQWAVADASTAELMKRFYAHLKQGEEKGTALCKAMLELMGDGKHGHPFYWAPFVLVGDWR